MGLPTCAGASGWKAVRTRRRALKGLPAAQAAWGGAGVLSNGPHARAIWNEFSADATLFCGSGHLHS